MTATLWDISTQPIEFFFECGLVHPTWFWVPWFGQSKISDWLCSRLGVFPRQKGECFA
jgi:hypothetical protein